MHPLIEQFCRIPGVSQCQPHFFNRVQRELRDTIQPLLDERDRLAVENQSLRAEIEAQHSELDRLSKKAQRRDAGAVA